MQLRHMQLLRKMIDEKIDEKKIISYFLKEKYSEEEIIREITDYEQEKEIKKISGTGGI